MHPILTLTSDFGRKDAYVAAMTGAILSIAPNARLVNISHDITPQDVMEAAHVLSGAAPYFPRGTIHIVVVDPDVGTSRLGIAVEHNGQLFVGPDNGLFSLLFQDASPGQMVQLDNPRYWRTERPSLTFHGRDIFAPVAAHLAMGTPLEQLGSPVSQMTKMQWPLPISDDQGIQGWVIHVDGFGNCITNIKREQFENLQQDRPFKCYVGNAILELKLETYADTASGEMLILFNSEDLLEVAINRGDAASLLDIRKGSPVNVVFAEER